MKNFLFSMLFVCLLAFSANPQTYKAKKDIKCPNLFAICSMIGSRTPDNSPVKPFKYLYQRRLLEGAGVVDEKDEKIIAEKVSKYWSQCEDELVCDAFDTPGSSIIKYAVSSNFDLFLEDITFWGVNLNRVDKVDDRTPLDYIKYQLERNKGNPLETKLKYYYNLLRESGAKHKSEL